MRNIFRIGVIGLALAATAAFQTVTRDPAPQSSPSTDRTYPELETRLAPLARKLGPPRPGEWLHEHKEPGQTFGEYVKAQPVRRSRRWKRIYLCLVGEFSDEQRRLLNRTCEYLELFFDTPVVVHAHVKLADVPAEARRKHPAWGDAQILTTYVLHELLKPNRPEDALAYLAFTASDLWPGENWNYVFGQASLHERTGVWSIYRNGDPAAGAAAFQLCLKRTLGTASHETAHILTMQHCTAFECSMNGSNSQVESDAKPLRLCPTCLRKLCWNLQVEPTAYLRRLERFCRKAGFLEDAEWYARAIQVLFTRDPG
jgi:archaemetzincin